MCPSCAITSSERELFRAKVARDINLLESLRAKLALAIGDIECNLAYNEIKVARPDALDEPWSNDMSGPYKHIGKPISGCNRL